MFAQFAQSTLNYSYSTDPSATTSTNGGVSAAALGIGALAWIAYVAIWVLAIVVMWRIFTKAGRPGWASIIPIYNTYTLIKIAGRPGWWIVLLFIPIVNIIVAIMLGADIGERFGHSRAFGAILLGLLGIGYIFIAFNRDTYRPLGAETPATPMASTPATPLQ